MAWARRLTLAAIGLGLAGATAWALWPQPAPVDMAVLARGPLRETVAAEGMTRVREPYAITAPISGVVGRSPVQVGDAVLRGQTVVAVISPAEPTLMDARARAQAEAAVNEAEASVMLADTNLRRALSGLSNAQTDLDRARLLADAGTIPRRALEDAQAAFTTASQALASARSERDLHQATLVRVRAQLLAPEDLADGGAAQNLLAPQSGTVLSVADQSQRPVQAGASLLSIGDLGDLDLEIDLLSSDAVRVRDGAQALVERWGGEGTLQAVVRRIEPAAFTRVSALGIEEQRVRLRLDFITPADRRAGLGDRYRVFVRVVVWEGENLLLAPQSALFRSGGGWGVFRAIDGVAVMTPVQIGHQAEGMAEVLEGLAAGETVVLYPASTLADGATIVARGQ